MSNSQKTENTAALFAESRSSPVIPSLIVDVDGHHSPT